MAYIRKVGDRWRAEVERQGKRTSKRFRTRREAELWAAQQEAAIASGADVKIYDKTVQDGIDRYLADVSATKKNPKQDRTLLNSFTKDNPALAATLLADVRPSDIVAWRNRRLKTIQPAGLLRAVTPIKHMFRLAGWEWGWGPKESPFDGVEFPSAGPPRDRLVLPSEVRRILRSLGYITGETPATKTQEAAWAFLISLHTAMRGGEILRLSRSTVDLRQRVVTLKDHKTVRTVGTRQVPITKRAAALLRMLDDAAKDAGRDAYFTLDDDGKNVLFHRHVRDYLLIEDLHFHDARATALTRMAKRVDVMVLARISGHKNLRTLLGTYYRATAAEIAAGL